MFVKALQNELKFIEDDWKNVQNQTDTYNVVGRLITLTKVLLKILAEEA